MDMKIHLLGKHSHNRHMAIPGYSWDLTFTQREHLHGGKVT